MSLSLLHPLLAGLGIAVLAVPIVIHLLLRQRPKSVLFPALLFLRKKEVQTVRRLRLQHWILLFVRCALLSLLGLALARPTLRSSVLAIDQEAPIAAAMIFDDSPSMGYTEKGETRLARVRSVALEAASRLPAASELAVLTTSDISAQSLMPVRSAQPVIQSLELSTEKGSLTSALVAGLELLARSSIERREIYIFSDLAQHAWKNLADSRVVDLLTQVGKDCPIYVVDGSAEKISQSSIEAVKLPGSVVSLGSEAEAEVIVRTEGETIDQTIRLTIDGEPRGEKTARIPANQAVGVRFPVTGLAEGIHQGEVRLVADDPLLIDNTRYFTLDVRTPPRVLIITENSSESLYLRKALEPAASTQDRQLLKEIRPSEWEKADFASFDIVALLNVSRLDQSGWSRLADFVAQGAGVLVAAGDRVMAEDYNSPAAQQVIPARLEQIQQGPSTRLSLGDKPHPLLARLNAWGQTDLTESAVLRYWKIAAAHSAAVVVLSYADAAPALIDRAPSTAGGGHVLLLTTPLHYQAKDIWNELPLTWSFVVLAEEMTRYLSGVGEVRLDYVAGDSVTLPRRPNDPFTLYALQDAGGVVERIAVEPRDTAITIPEVRTLGPYSVRASAPPRQWQTGFCVNIDSAESQLARTTEAEISASLAAPQVQLVKNAGDLERVEGSTRVGRELFPWIMLLVVALLFAEAFLSNRFYRRA